MGSTLFFFLLLLLLFLLLASNLQFVSVAIRSRPPYRRHIHLFKRHKRHAP
jgi:hypothetical protein